MCVYGCVFVCVCVCVISLLCFRLARLLLFHSLITNTHTHTHTHTHSCPIPRIEYSMQLLLATLGVDGSFSVLPAVIFVSFGLPISSQVCVRVCVCVCVPLYIYLCLSCFS